MATDSFKFWDSYMHALDRVDDATAGMLVKALCHKVFEGAEPVFDDPVLTMVLDVMYGQASRSAEMAALGRKGGQNSGKARSKKSGSDASKRKTSDLNSASNVKKREEKSSNDSLLFSEEKYGPAAGADAPPPPYE